MKNQKNTPALVVKRVTKRSHKKKKELAECKGGSCSRRTINPSKEKGYFDSFLKQTNKDDDSITSESNSFTEENIKDIGKSKSVVVKRGLMIGINYTGSSNALNGCIND